jgi:hypothetical protein
MRLLRLRSEHANGFNSISPRYLTSTVSELAGAVTGNASAAMSQIL